MMRHLYKKISALVLVCTLYMFMVCVFHLGFQDRHWQTNDQDDLSLKSAGIQNLIHEDIQNRIYQDQYVRANQNVAQDSPPPTDQPEHRQMEHNYQSYTEATSKIKAHTETANENHQQARQPPMMRKLKENAQEPESAPGQEDMMTHDDRINVNDVFTHPTTLQVLQHKVDFLFLGDFYVYGTFLDKRYSESDYIRVLILRPTFNKTRWLMCQFPSSDNVTTINVQAAPYEMCENHGKKYGGWIYSCQLPKTDGALLLTITLQVVTENMSVLDTLRSVPLQPLTPEEYILRSAHNLVSQHKLDVDINNTKRGSENYEHQAHFRDNNNLLLGVCVPPLHGDISLSKLISFIEMCRLLGADKIFLYIHDIPIDILAFLQNYTGVSSRILDLILWDFPVVDTKTPLPATNQIIWNHGQLLAVQHCLYTNMAHFDWLLFIDIDEMLVPQRMDTWPELLSVLTNQFYSQFPSGSFAGISFKSTFCQQDFQTQVKNSIPYFQYLYCTRETSSQRSKLFIRPFHVFEMGLHHISKAVDEEMRVIRAGVGDGLLHHYRKCVPGANIDLRCDILVKDETILKYEAPLTIANREVITGAMEFFAHYR